MSKALAVPHALGFATNLQSEVDQVSGQPIIVIPGMGSFPLKDFYLDQTLRVTLNETSTSAGVFILPGSANSRTLKATMTGVAPVTKAVKLKTFVSNNGSTWVGPDTDPSLELVVATTNTISDGMLEITGNWTHIRFELTDQIGSFALVLEVA